MGEDAPQAPGRIGYISDVPGNHVDVGMAYGLPCCLAVVEADVDGVCAVLLAFDDGDAT